MCEVRRRVYNRYLGSIRCTDCSVDLCFCTSGDGIDGSRRCFLEYVDSLRTTRRIILTGWRERREKRESERLVRVPVSYRGM